MTDELIASVRAGDLERARALLASGADVEARDEHGWTALCWAAGAGHVALVRLLLDRGADVFATGRDRRTPYQIALAATRVDAARLLAEAERAAGGDAALRSSGQAAQRPYCRAYELRELRRFPAWSEPRPDAGGADALSEDTVVFVHRDFSVTRSMWPREDVVFEGASGEWQRFCVDTLGFHPPDDFDWLPGSADV